MIRTSAKYFRSISSIEEEEEEFVRWHPDYQPEVALPPVFADVRSLVLANWQEEQRERFNAQFFESLKSRYEIVIEEIPDLPGGRGKADTRANGASAREVRPES